MTNEKVLEIKKALQQTEVKIIAHKRVLDKIDCTISYIEDSAQEFIECAFEDKSYLEELQEEKKIYAHIMQKLAEKVLNYKEVKRKLEALLNEDSQN